MTDPPPILQVDPVILLGKDTNALIVIPDQGNKDVQIIVFRKRGLKSRRQQTYPLTEVMYDSENAKILTAIRISSNHQIIPF